MSKKPGQEARARKRLAKAIEDAIEYAKPRLIAAMAESPTMAKEDAIATVFNLMIEESGPDVALAAQIVSSVHAAIVRAADELLIGVQAQ